MGSDCLAFFDPFTSLKIKMAECAHTVKCKGALHFTGSSSNLIAAGTKFYKSKRTAGCFYLRYRDLSDSLHSSCSSIYSRMPIRNISQSHCKQNKFRVSEMTRFRLKWAAKIGTPTQQSKPFIKGAFHAWAPPCKITRRSSLSVKKKKKWGQNTCHGLRQRR